MTDNKKTMDYQSSINRARRKRNRRGMGPLLPAVCILCAALALFGAGRAVWSRVHRDGGRMEEMTAEALTEAGTKEAAVTEIPVGRDAEAMEIINSYPNLGIVSVSGFLNMRKSPEPEAHVVGKLIDGSACSVLETLDGWYRVSSGGVEGYVSSEYVLTGDDAKAAAGSLVKDMAIITADFLNVRREPSTSADIVGQCVEDERYEILSEADGWYQIADGYISADYAEKKFCMNEARKLDVRAMALYNYDRPGVSNVTTYLNIRKGPGENEAIIGKLPSYAGCEILEETDGWYKIQSGPITGYVSRDYILTGDAARDAAASHAQLMAIVSADRLNARTEPSTDARIWTQISNNERYHVVSQLDGWVQIEFDEGGEGDGNDEVSTAYVSTDYVDVRYALAEAIKFSQSGDHSSLRNQIVNYAMQFLGNPYVWGGTSLTRGADCSGFTMSVMKHFGISLPHYSGDQAKRGTRIKSSEMRPGDLIFYGNSRGKINHVSMYIGNGQVIHAASKRSGIKISAWNYRTPLKIVNVIGK